MSNLRAAFVEAVYNALNVPSVTALGAVYQHVPEDTQPPCVLIRKVDLTPEGGKDGGLYRATVAIEVYYRGAKGTAHQAQVDAVEAALKAGSISATGLTPVTLFDPLTTGGEQGEDGVTYETTITAEALIQPA